MASRRTFPLQHDAAFSLCLTPVSRAGGPLAKRSIGASRFPRRPNRPARRRATLVAEPLRRGRPDRHAQRNHARGGAAATALVKTGQVVDLGRVLDENTPKFPGRYWQQTVDVSPHFTNLRRPDAELARAGAKTRSTGSPRFRLAPFRSAPNWIPSATSRSATASTTAGPPATWWSLGA
jgi:hypothetical protein